jgi:L-2-hydroxyglutarate oxidase LhgO
MAERVKITIIGAGVVGCAVAYQLSKKYDEIFVIEKNPKVTAENQSSRNSGVIHAGIYYPKDESPLKAKLCVEGNRMLYDFCQEFDVPHKQTGKLVMATETWQLDYLRDTFQIAQQNNVPGAKIISAEETKKMEPNVHCIQAAYFPTSGIIEATRLVYRLFTLASQNGVYFLTQTEVLDIKPKNGYFEIATKSGNQIEIFETEILINSAGLYSDEIARKINPDCPYQIFPVRGEMAKFYKSRRENIFHSGMNLYPVPHPLDANGKKLVIAFDEFQKLFKAKKVLKTVGAHLTPTFDLIDGSYEIGNIVTIGPATKGVSDIEDYTHDLFPPEYYFDLVHPFFPNLKVDDVSLHQTGIQAKLKNRFDWVIEPDEKHPKCIQLIGIDSPGLTACLAIGKYVGELMNFQ